MEKCLYDESLQKGTDYLDPRKVREYDAKMLSFRDYVAEAALIVDTLQLGPHESILDIGCGTGGVSLHVARSCNWLTGIDISRPMLDFAREKAKAADVHNATFQPGGFLKNDLPMASFNAVMTNAALHHLPDFWKAVALFRINQLLKEDGRLFLGDVVFGYPLEQYRERSLSWIERMEPIEPGEARAHLKEEYSTFSWIMEGLLDRTGFEWTRVGGDDYFAQYVCHKIRSFKDWGQESHA